MSRGGMVRALVLLSALVLTVGPSAREEVPAETDTSSLVHAMPQMSRTTALLHGTDLRDIIELNDPVKAALDDWLTWMRPKLMNAWENYHYLRPRIAPIYEEAGLPEALLFAMLATESGGKVHSFSRAGAAGPLQFMRYTGRRYGLSVVDGFDMRLDPEAATRANVAFLNDLFEDLNGSLEMVIAAYNGGENRLARLNRRKGSKSLWDRTIYYSLPRETREYVPRVLAAAWLFLHPEDFNLEFPEIDPETATLVLEDDMSLGELTICLGQEQNEDGWFRTLRNLNPRIKPDERIPAGETVEMPVQLVPVYREACLANDLVARARELHDANYPPEGTMVYYTVERRDTLGRIASRHDCVSMSEIAEINGIRGPKYVIRVGQLIKIPSCP